MSELTIKDQIWLTSLSTGGATVRVKGVAMDERTVADFMTKLEKSGIFPVVNLSTVKRKTFGVVSTIMCEIILCHIFHKWQVGGNFTYGFRPPVDFHL